MAKSILYLNEDKYTCYSTDDSTVLLINGNTVLELDKEDTITLICVLAAINGIESEISFNMDYGTHHRLNEYGVSIDWSTDERH